MRIPDDEVEELAAGAVNMCLYRYTIECMCTDVCMYMWVYMYMHICMYISIYIYMCVFT